MKLIRYEKPEFGPSLGRFENWFRNGDPFLSVGTWPGLFEWENQDLFGSSSRQMKADLFEDDDHYFARFELPGVKKKDVNIELHNAVLTVSYEHSHSEAGAESAERYSRSISVPDGVDASKISATQADGLLTITMPKEEAKKPRTIEIK